MQAQYYLLSFGHLWETAVSMTILRLINNRLLTSLWKNWKLQNYYRQTGNKKDLRHTPLTASLYPFLQPLLEKEHFCLEIPGQKSFFDIKIYFYITGML